jgi:hypothetical protein
MRLFSANALVLALTLTSVAQSPKPLPAGPDVTLTFTTEDNQHQFHLGELIPITFSYRAGSPGKYILVSLSNKLVGGRGIEVSCVPSAEQAERTHLGINDDIFEQMLYTCVGHGGGIGGGCADCDSEQPLTDSPIEFGSQVLNTYVRFRTAGRYSCVASSADLTTASAQEKIRPALLIESSPLELNVVDDPAWSHSAVETYTAAYKKLCRGNDVTAEHIPFQCGDLSARITYLDTLESLSAEVSLLDGRTRSWDSGFWQAIQDSSFPGAAVQLLTKRIQDSDFQVSPEILQWLAVTDLRMDLPTAFDSSDPTAYHSQAVEKMRKFVQLLGNSMRNKNSAVLPESRKTFLSMAEQSYCEENPLISREERQQMLARPVHGQ